MLGGGAK
ncbi:hypothetical protein VC95412_001637A, partial [Vibrio cholerae O1 str. 95412]